MPGALARKPAICAGQGRMTSLVDLMERRLHAWSRTAPAGISIRLHRVREPLRMDPALWIDAERGCLAARLEMFLSGDVLLYSRDLETDAEPHHVYLRVADGHDVENAIATLLTALGVGPVA